ncbi:MAG TPA: DinB family protein [Balneolales bacterium]|nr:DinB family protein [Balneolales bacterium]
MKLSRPSPEEYPDFYKEYVDQVIDKDILKFLEEQKDDIILFFNQIPDPRMDYRYSKEKWNIKEIISHIIDTERIFAYRALCIARGDTTSLPGFDQDSYVSHSNADNLLKGKLVREFETLRISNLKMFNNFNVMMWNRKGYANSLPISTRAIPFIIAGHLQHHKSVIRGKYLKS